MMEDNIHNEIKLILDTEKLNSDQKADIIKEMIRSRNTLYIPPVIPYIPPVEPAYPTSPFYYITDNTGI